MPVSKNMFDKMNGQIQKEFFSEYFYLSMAAYFAEQNLDGFSNFFLVQALEERDHAMLFFNYILETGGKVELREIGKPKHDFASPIQIFELALEHEKFITKSIHELMDVAVTEKDFTSQSFLTWFVNEQREEEATAERVLSKLKRIENDGRGLLILDAELATRVYTPATIDKT